MIHFDAASVDPETVSYFYSEFPVRFTSLAEWIREKRRLEEDKSVFENMCDLCNGSKDDHFKGCPDDWCDIWDY